MRGPYLATMALGRSAWASPEENEWDSVAQTAMPVRTRTGARLDGQYEEDVQQYDSNLRPINPASQSKARERRVAANNILSIIGVVEQTHDTEREKNAEKQAQETPYLIPVFFLTRAALMVTSQWILNITNRLMAYRSPPEMSLTMTVAQDYKQLGPLPFFFSGIPATLAEFFVRPSWLAPISCYWLFRLLLANISDLSIRNYLIGKSPLAYQISWGVFELFDFPFRLNVLLQQLGLIHPFGILPTSQVFRATYGSPLNLLSTPLPAIFLYGPLAHIVNRSVVKPRVVPFIDRIFQAFEEDSPKSHTPVASPPREESTLQGSSHVSQNAPTSLGQATRRYQARSRHSTPPSLLHFSEDTRQVEDVQTDQRNVINSPTPVASPSAAPVAESPAEETAMQNEVYHQIRITGHEGSDGALIEELNISFYDRITEGSDHIVSADRNSRRRPTRRHDLPLSDTPQRIAEALITAHVTSILLQPFDAWILPRVASWWLSNQGAEAQYPHVMEEIVAAPFFSGNHFQSVMFQTSKVLLCIAIREVIMAGVWAAQTKAVIWLGKRRLGWPSEKNKTS